ncbi:hypothetical protein [Treponema saccharophilum]|uniref:Transposase n=1 Tax=Treponema saccharophilum DSM 2985 TaxID=907348 RepID=H7ENI9_9SPIR|nr:hypothetical protein [Treponema saccharophilum]EIC00917.1 hypothetical protein TresaDRAFT_0742 [Treponema saccharophilum DSM 2985]BDC95162.1 hypothetical protein TRSA_02610 [Treponema saccharophilum]
MQAKKSLSNISKNKELWIAQWKQESFERDIRSGLNAAMQQGIQQGITQVAKNMLSTGIPLEQISKLTGLSTAEIQSL